jgi:hypothetical protein
MAEQTNTIEFEFKGAKTLKQELREANTLLQQMVASGKASEEQIAAQTAKVAGLKDSIDDTNDAVGALTGAGKFQAFGKSISAVAGGFSALSGAVALAGGESEDLQKTMVKLQAALAISQGLSQIEDLGNAFGNVKKVAGTAFDTIKSAGSKAFGSLKSAIISTGIGALVVGLGLVVANFDAIKTAIMRAIPGLETFANFMGKIITAVTDFVGITSAQDRAMEANIKTRDKQIESIDFEIQKAKLAGNEKKALQLEEKKLLAELSKARSQYTLEANADNAKQVRDLKHSLELKKLEQKKFDQEEKDKQTAKNKEAADKRKEEAARIKKEKEAADKSEDDRQKAALKQQQAFQDERTLLEIKDENERSKKALELKQLRQREELDLEIKGYEDRKEKLTAEEKETLEALQATRVELIKTQAAQTEQLKDDIAEKEKEKQKEKDDKAFQDAQDNADKLATLEQTALDKRFAEGLITQEEYEKQSEDLELKTLQDKLALYKQYGKDTTDIESQIFAMLAKKRTEDVDDTKQKEEEKKKARQESLQAGLEFAANTANQLLDLEKSRLEAQLSNQNLSEAERERIAKESFEKQKKLQYALAVIDAAKTTTSILAQYPKFDGGIAMFAALATTAITLAISLSKIAATKYVSPNSDKKDAKLQGSKFQEGGLLMGPPHSEGGIQTNLGELEGGEFVINKQATKDNFKLLKAINDNKLAKLDFNIPYTANNFDSKRIQAMSDILMEQQGALIAMANAPAMKAYVVASDMSSQQEADKRISDLARL